MDMSPDQLSKVAYVAAVGLVVGLVTTFTSMTLSNSNRISTLESDLAWIKGSLQRIEAAQSVRKLKD